MSIRTSAAAGMAMILMITSNRDKSRLIGAKLESAGYQMAASSMSEDLRRQMLKHPPQAIILDLERAPATGRDLGLFLRAQKATRHSVLLFLDGDTDRVREIQRLLPDAIYTDAESITRDLGLGLANPPRKPVVPDSVFAGYVGRPLPAKLGIKPKMRISLIDAPPDFEKKLAPLPEDVLLTRTTSAGPDLTLWFTTSLADLESGLDDRLRMAHPGKIWIVWPKRSSGMKSDLTQTSVRQAGLRADWVDFKICSVDATWSGLCFTARKEK